MQIREELGNSSYKASELGKERKLLASRLYRTWVQLHEQHEEPVMENRNPARPKQETKVPVITVSLPKKNKNNGEFPVKPKSNKPLESASPLPVKPVAQEIYHDSFSVNGKDFDLTIHRKWQSSSASEAAKPSDEKRQQKNGRRLPRRFRSKKPK